MDSEVVRLGVVVGTMAVVMAGMAGAATPAPPTTRLWHKEEERAPPVVDWSASEAACEKEADELLTTWLVLLGLALVEGLVAGLPLLCAFLSHRALLKSHEETFVTAMKLACRSLMVAVPLRATALVQKTVGNEEEKLRQRLKSIPSTTESPGESQ